VVTCRNIGPRRVLKNELADRLLAMESAGATTSDMEDFLGITNRVRKGELDGNLVGGEVYCGAIAGMITDILNAGEIVENIIQGSTGVVTGLNRLWT